MQSLSHANTSAAAISDWNGRENVVRLRRDEAISFVYVGVANSFSQTFTRVHEERGARDLGRPV